MNTVKVKFVFEAFRMDTKQLVAEKSQAVFELDMEHPDRVDDVVKVAMLLVERQLRDDVRKALGLPSRVEEMAASVEAMKAES